MTTYTTKRHPNSDEADQDQPIDKSKTDRVASRIPETFPYLDVSNPSEP